MIQSAIAITACIAIWLATEPLQSRRRWASIFGLVGQPFWFWSAWQASQWGVLAACVIYTIAWSRSFRQNWISIDGRTPH